MLGEQGDKDERPPQQAIPDRGQGAYLGRSPAHALQASGLEKSAFQRRVEAQLNKCCLCGGSGHNSTNCPWSKE